MLYDLLTTYSIISGYKVNYEKSNFMGVHIIGQNRDDIKHVSRARWENDFVRYLGINISVDFPKLVQNNIIHLVNSTKE